MPPHVQRLLANLIKTENQWHWLDRSLFYSAEPTSTSIALLGWPVCCNQSHGGGWWQECKSARERIGVQRKTRKGLSDCLWVRQKRFYGQHIYREKTKWKAEVSDGTMKMKEEIRHRARCKHSFPVLFFSSLLSMMEGKGFSATILGKKTCQTW